MSRGRTLIAKVCARKAPSWTQDDDWLDPPGYAARVAQLESEGMTTSDAQSVADAEFMREGK